MPRPRDRCRNRLGLALAIPAVAFLACSETSRPPVDPPEPPPAPGTGRLAGDLGLHSQIDDLHLLTPTGPLEIAADGVFAIPADSNRVQRPFVLARADGTPILLGILPPDENAILLGARSTAETLFAIDPILWGLPDPIRDDALAVAASVVGPLEERIRAGLIAGRWGLIADESAPEIHADAAARLRAAIASMRDRAGAGTAGRPAADLPYADAGRGEETAPAVVNPTAIHFVVSAHEYFRGRPLATQRVGPAALAEVLEIGEPSRTPFLQPAGRYRLSFASGRAAEPPQEGSPEAIAFRWNLVEALRGCARDGFAVRGPLPWADDPLSLALSGLAGIDATRTTMAGSDPAAFLASLVALAGTNAATILPGVDPVYAAAIGRVARAHVAGAARQAHGRFVTDLFVSAPPPDLFVAVRGRGLLVIDPPHLVRAPESLAAHYSNRRVYLSWVDRATNEDAYIVQRREDGFFREIVTLTPEADAFQDFDVRVGETYTYRVVARNQAAVSMPSNETVLTIGSGEDLTPPAAIVDLSAGEVGSESIEILWTAPGDDGSAGTAAQYDLRITRGVLDEATFGRAQRVTGVARPRSAGARERHLVRGLEPGVTYSLGIKTSDDEGNTSSLSNVLAVMTDPRSPDQFWLPGFGPYPYGQGLNGDVFALADCNGYLVAGGNFTYAGGTAASHIARWDGRLWRPLGLGVDGYVRCLAVFRGDLIAGGFFRQAGEVEVGGIARWDGTAWSALGSGLEGSAYSLAVHDDRLFVGGNFSRAGRVPARSIAAWNGSMWDSLGAGVSNQVFTLLSHGRDLIVGGDFGAAGGVPGTSEIARWDGAAWHSMAGGMDLDYVGALVVHRGELIAGGQFVHAGGVPAQNIARWDGSAWHPLGEGTDRWVLALAVFGDDLIAGGEFWTAGGGPTAYIARWDGLDWRPLGSGTNGAVRVLVGRGTRLLVGGRFSSAGNRASHGIAIWEE